MLAYVLDVDGRAGLTKIEPPKPNAGEVLIRVRATSVNPHDEHVRTGAARAYMEYDLPAVLGTDVAGEVEAVGSGVRRIQVGDRVFGLERSRRVHNGTFAEYVALPEDAVARTPDSLGDAHAGALGLAALMALTAIDAAQLEPKQTILINGATGGVGCYATQLATAAGAHVLATARPGAEANLLREFGAATTIDWSTRDVGAAAADAGGVDVLLDLVTRDAGELERLSACALARGGRVFTTLIPESRAEMLFAISSPELLDRIAGHAARGSIKVPLGRRFELAALEQAFFALRDGAVGKIGVSL
jgi:NADPH:quinone reductase-like Zn-dependent oxidoreductase